MLLLLGLLELPQRRREIPHLLLSRDRLFVLVAAHHAPLPLRCRGDEPQVVAEVGDALDGADIELVKRLQGGSALQDILLSLLGQPVLHLEVVLPGFGLPGLLVFALDVPEVVDIAHDEFAVVAPLFVHAETEFAVVLRVVDLGLADLEAE